jgi:diketogulonate reductase-like aldo/keto reductase
MHPDATIPKIGFGTWQIGGRMDPDESQRKVGVEIIRNAYESGYRLFDTAEIYASGLTEEIIGEALSIYPRDDYYLISKVWKDHLSYAGMRKACTNSLKRLRTDYLDLYLVHWPNNEVDICDTMHSMEFLKNDNKVNNIGLSNYSLELMKEAIGCLENQTIDFVQNEFNLYNKEIELDILPFCIDSGIGVISYSPFAKGSLAANPPQELLDVSNKYQRTPAQVALRWIIDKGAIPIPKSSSQERMKQNIDVLSWNLNEEDISLLDTIEKKQL